MVFLIRIDAVSRELRALKFGSLVSVVRKHDKSTCTTYVFVFYFYDLNLFQGTEFSRVTHSLSVALSSLRMQLV